MVTKMILLEVDAEADFTMNWWRWCIIIAFFTWAFWYLFHLMRQVRAEQAKLSEWIECELRRNVAVFELCNLRALIKEPFWNWISLDSTIAEPFARIDLPNATLWIFVQTGRGLSSDAQSIVLHCDSWNLSHIKMEKLGVGTRFQFSRAPSEVRALWHHLFDKWCVKVLSPIDPKLTRTLDALTTFVHEKTATPIWRIETHGSFVSLVGKKIESQRDFEESIKIAEVLKETLCGSKDVA